MPDQEQYQTSAPAIRGLQKGHCARRREVVLPRSCLPGWCKILRYWRENAPEKRLTHRLRDTLLADNVRDRRSVDSGLGGRADAVSCVRSPGAAAGVADSVHGRA